MATSSFVSDAIFRVYFPMFWHDGPVHSIINVITNFNIQRIQWNKDTHAYRGMYLYVMNGN